MHRNGHGVLSHTRSRRNVGANDPSPGSGPGHRAMPGFVHGRVAGVGPCRRGEAAPVLLRTPPGFIPGPAPKSSCEPTRIMVTIPAEHGRATESDLTLALWASGRCHATVDSV